MHGHTRKGIQIQPSEEKPVDKRQPEKPSMELSSTAGRTDRVQRMSTQAPKRNNFSPAPSAAFVMLFLKRQSSIHLFVEPKVRRQGATEESRTTRGRKTPLCLQRSDCPTQEVRAKHTSGAVHWRYFAPQGNASPLTTCLRRSEEEARATPSVECADDALR